MGSLTFKQTRDISKFRTLIDTLIPDFDYVFLHTILQWCGLATDPYKDSDKFWEVWLFDKTQNDTNTIGICGLYSLVPGSTKELWLGWFGIVPDERNQKHGIEVMQFLYDKARAQGCERIYSYVDKGGKPLSFYKREGFEIIGTVGEYLAANAMEKIDGDDFECAEDYVIMKKL